MGWNTSVIRVSTGTLNTVNDTYIGGAPAGYIGGTAPYSQYAGQLGKPLIVGQDQIAVLTNTTIGTLYTGVYQYVRLAAASAAPVIGQVAFWDNSADPGLFQVTDVEGTTTTQGVAAAGIFINAITPGNYGFIQTEGIATVKYQGSLTGTPSIGVTVVVGPATSATGDGGFADVITALTTTGGAPVLNRFLGWALALPVAGALGTVQLRLSGHRY